MSVLGVITATQFRSGRATPRWPLTLIPSLGNSELRGKSLDIDCEVLYLVHVCELVM